MEFYEYLREKESTLIDAIGLKNFKEEKAYFINEVEAMVEDYIKFKKLGIADVMAMLPTDEEIKEIMTTNHYHYEKGHYRKVRLDRIQGAKIIRDLIKKKIEGN